MKSAGKARNNGLYRHIRTSKEIIRNLLNDSLKYLWRYHYDRSRWQFTWHKSISNTVYTDIRDSQSVLYHVFLQKIDGKFQIKQRVITVRIGKTFFESVCGGSKNTLRENKILSA